MELVLGDGRNLEPLISALVESGAHSHIGYEVAAYYPQHESPALLELAQQIPISLAKLTSSAYASGDRDAYSKLLDAHVTLFREAPTRGLDAILYSAAQSPGLQDALAESVSNTYLNNIGKTHVLALVDELDAEYTGSADAQMLARLLVNIARTSPEAKTALEELRAPDIISSYDTETADILTAAAESSSLTIL